jgi:hypothetical protein
MIHGISTDRSRKKWITATNWAKPKQGAGISPCVNLISSQVISRAKTIAGGGQ